MMQNRRRGMHQRRFAPEVGYPEQAWDVEGVGIGMAPSTEPNDLVSVRRALERLAREHTVSVRTSVLNAVCLETSVGDLCVLVVPNRSEIEVWLSARSDDADFRYPLVSMQQVMGNNNKAFLYNSSTLQICIADLSSFLGDFLSLASEDPEGLKLNLRKAYDEMVERSLVSEKRDSAERLWASGRYKEAAKFYEEIPQLSKVEGKRLELTRSGKTPRKL